MYYIVYKTTNLLNNKEYIGIHKTEKLDDGYLGSGLAIKRAIKKYGEQNFKREILEFCSSYEELLDREKHYVNEEWVCLKNTYNLKTGGQSSGLLSEESKLKISKTLKEKYSKGEIIPRKTAPYVATDEQKEKISKSLKDRYKEVEHHKKGVEPWNKGKKGIQAAWNKNLKTGPISEEQKEKISKSLKDRYKEVEHHNTNKEPWNKGKKGVQNAWNKGKKSKQVVCPYCSKTVDILNASRWHFENCKLKDAFAASYAADNKC